jgi:hypothetical protein
VSEQRDKAQESGGRLRRVAVVHERASSLVVAERRDGSPRIVEVRQVDVSNPEQLRKEMHRLKADRVIHLIPASETVVRLIEIPGGDAEHMIDALDLLAEAELPDTVPAHRRGAGVIPLPASGGHRAALLTAWTAAPGNDSVDLPEERWTSEVSALPWLLGKHTGAYAFTADRRTGSVAITGRQETRGVVRATRVDGGDKLRFVSSVQSAVAECGIESLQIPSDGNAVTMLDDASTKALAEHAPGQSIDAAWLNRYGVAAGAAIGALRSGTAGARLFELRRQPPRRHIGPGERTVRWLVRPVNAGVLVALGLLAMLIVPYASAQMRKNVLEGQLQQVRETVGDMGELQRRSAFYAALEDRRWPMTKLLADIASAMPVGVQAESITITAGERWTLRGTAERSSLISQFVANLNDSGVFQANQAGRESTEEGVEFDLEGFAPGRFSAASELDDFSEQTLSIRLYGEEVPLVRVSTDEEGEDGSSGGSRSASRSSGGRRSIFSGSGDRSPEPEPVPEALSDEQISEMDRTATMKEFGDRRRASNRADIDAETRQRLEDEVEKLRNRLRELKGS